MVSAKPVVRGEIANFSADGHKRSSMSLGVVHDTAEAQCLASEHSMAKEKPMADGDYCAFRTFIDWTEQYAWLGQKERFQCDQDWIKV